VPKLACLECPLLGPPALPGLMGLVGDVDDGAGEVLILDRVGEILPDEIAFSRPSLTPLGVIGWSGDSGCSDGVEGSDDERMAFPSSESASKSSGGRRSFSMSDLRLCPPELGSSTVQCKENTHASWNPLMASLISSMPEASVP